MTKRLWSSVLVASLLLAAWPERNQAAEAPKTLRGAVERVVAQAETDRTDAAPQLAGPATALDSHETRDLVQRARALQSNPAAGQMSGGGMGKMLIMTLLTTAVSVGAYMYIIKKSNQQTTTATLR